MLENSVRERIENDINNNDIVLYMKGSKHMPQCGFSAVVVQILTNLGLEFKDVNVLLDSEVRQAIKEYSNWPTIPQLYIKQEFVGGCDIVREMYQSSELQELLENKGLFQKVNA
jgi:monothiol glutaredoxin